MEVTLESLGRFAVGFGSFEPKCEERQISKAGVYACARQGVRILYLRSSENKRNSRAGIYPPHWNRYRRPAAQMKSLAS